MRARRLRRAPAAENAQAKTFLMSGLAVSIYLQLPNPSRISRRFLSVQAGACASALACATVKTPTNLPLSIRWDHHTDSPAQIYYPEKRCHSTTLSSDWVSNQEKMGNKG